MQTFIFDRIR